MFRIDADPVSQMETQSPRPISRRADRRHASRSLPPSGIAWIALPIRLRNTCLSSTGKPWTIPCCGSAFENDLVEFQSAGLQFEDVVKQVGDGDFTGCFDSR